VLLCGGEVSPIGNQKKGGTMTCTKDYFGKNSPKVTIFQGEQKKVEITIFRP
jgi:hypothetical protein